MNYIPIMTLGLPHMHKQYLPLLLKSLVQLYQFMSHTIDSKVKIDTILIYYSISSDALTRFWNHVNY